MATIYERKKKLQKEMARFVRKLRSLQDECPHPADRRVTSPDNVVSCIDCGKLMEV
jgi:hypothetical protein